MKLYKIDKELIIKVLSEGIIKRYEKNEIIYYQNSDPFYLFLVLSGEIIFKIFKTEDMLKIVNASNTIIPRKEGLCKKYYFSVKQKIIELSRLAFENGRIDTKIKEPTNYGTFFNEEKLALDKKYENCAVAHTDCILLVIPNIFFNTYLKNKIKFTILNVYDSFYARFKLTIDTNQKLFQLIINRSQNIFPEINEIIIKENDTKIYLNLFFIYEGKVAVNKNNLGDIIYLNKGEIFGAEALIAILNKEKEKEEEDDNSENSNYVVHYKYNIVNRSKDTILFIIELSNFDKNDKIMRCLNMNLLSYFIEQQKIIKRLEDKKIIFKKNFTKKYKNLSSRNIITIEPFNLNKGKCLINALVLEKEKLNVNNYIIIKKKENHCNKTINAINVFNKSMNTNFKNKIKNDICKYSAIKRNRKNNSLVFKEKNKNKNKNINLGSDLFITSTSRKTYISPIKKHNSYNKERILSYERNATTNSKKKNIRIRNRISNKDVKLFSIYNNCYEIFKEIKRNNNINLFKIDSYINRNKPKYNTSQKSNDFNTFNKNSRRKRLSIIARNKLCLDINNS